MANVSVVKKYELPASKIWEVVTKAGDMDIYFPDMISACRVDTSTVGGKRVCSTAQGDILETILLNDADTMTFKYSIDNDDAPMPVSNYVGRVVLKALTKNATEFSWSASFAPKGMPEQDVVAMLEGVLGTIMDNMVQKAKDS